VPQFTDVAAASDADGAFVVVGTAGDGYVTLAFRGLVAGKLGRAPCDQLIAR